MIGPFSPDGKRRLTVSQIAKEMNCFEPTVRWAAELVDPERLKPDVETRFKERKAYEIRNWILSTRRIYARASGE